ncbi:MAG: hypothetical protein F6K09_04805 [Merismopedia sp. SIO2A8]|nr:hypothetical protein [Merismopedia sp. SIO2A8]
MMILWSMEAVAEQVTLILPDALARRARDVAASTQRDLEEVLLEWINRTSLQIDSPNAVPITEVQLLQQVNIGFSVDWWSRYRALVAERQAETISEQHLSELLEMSEALEMANVNRVKALGELAHLRGCSIEDVMDALDIRPRAEADG